MKPTERNLDGSLEQCKDELRDAYMNFKDLQTRCIIDIRSPNISGLSDTQQVYYHKPETFMLDDLDKQRQYRESLLKNIGTLPKPEKYVNAELDLSNKIQEKISAQQTPNQTKQMLADYFKRQQYSLQHLKYKLLCRWAHHTLTSERIETIGSEATYLLGKLEMSLENAIQRSERLSQNDYYGSLQPEDRPSTLANEGAPLYVENFDIAQQSLIKEDDIEVYIRGTTYRNKVNKTFNKFYARVKHLKMSQNDQIFEQAVEEYYKQKNENINKQKETMEAVKHNVQQNNVMTQDLKQELAQITKQYYCEVFDSLFLDQTEKWKYGWKPNHDEVPPLIDDAYLLKTKMAALGLTFGITGDIEIDQGYSYSYQITVFFPHCFQRQLLKTQFSIYDSFTKNSQNNDKTKLSRMPQIDTNIFKDVSTLKAQIPSMESVHQEFRNDNVKILRLKSAHSWIDYISLQAISPDWQTEQQAILDNATTDQLLKTTIQLLDMNDQYHAMKSMEESAFRHKDIASRLIQQNPHKQIKKVVVSTSDGDRDLVVDLLQYNNTNNGEPHVKDAVIGTSRKLSCNQEPEQQSVLRNLPRVVLTAYYQLRFLLMREKKTKILYALNYYRAIQKRLALDLREFKTRDRVDGNVANTLVQPKEATSNVSNQVNLQKKIHESVLLKQKSDRILASVYHPKMTVFETETIQTMKDMASLRFYKANGIFSNRIYETNPILAKCHVASDEPLIYEPQSEGKSHGVTDASIKLISRIDFIELDETLEEVYVKDDFGIYVLYDCVLQDMKSFEDHLLQQGSFFLNKAEVLLDPVQQPIPYRDRHEVLTDLLTYEAKFQFKKVRLIQVYMECYEHISCPLEQQRLMQTITDIMSLKPRLNLQANYFTDAYQAEIKCLDAQFELLRQVIDLQISLEKAENKRIQDSLGLSYTLASQLAKRKFKYQDFNSLLSALVPTLQSKLETELKVTTAVSVDVAKHQRKVKPVKTSSVQFDDGLSDSNEVESDHEIENQVDEQQENIFVKLLGLPKITIESIYQNYREQNINVISIMQQHNNFITCYEGYPQFITRLAEDSILPNNNVFKFNHWSQETGALDFYETLSIVNRLHRVQKKLQAQMYYNLWDPQLMTYIDTQIAIKMLDELRTVIKIQEGSLLEYEGVALVEDESVVGCADKVIFYAKEMISSFNNTPVNLQDPFVIAKLEPEQIALYSFAQQKKEQNKYTLRQRDGYAIAQDKQYLVNLAKSRCPINIQEKVQNLLQSSNHKQRIQAPDMLQLYCNLVEFMRMRQALIKAASEVSVLTKVYEAQSQLLGSVVCKVGFDQGIHFNTDPASRFVNFVEDGPSHMTKIGLAIQEFDNTMLSNFNFRNPDSLRLNILNQGLQETRVVLAYQVMQKYLLQLATKQNAALFQNYMRQISELKLFLVVQNCFPNSVEDYKQFFTRSFEGVCRIKTCNDVINTKADHFFVIKVLQKIKSVQSQLSSICSAQFCQVLPYKVQSRSQLQQEYQGRLVTVQRTYSSPVQVDSVMRTFRTELVHRFVLNTIQKICQDSQKLQCIQACNTLRVYNRLTEFSQYETTQFLDNFTVNYLPQKVKEFCTSNSVVDGIPSTVTIIQNSNNSVRYLQQVKLCQLLWFVQSLSLASEQAIHVNNCIQNGMLFKSDDEFDRRRKQILGLNDQSNQISQAIQAVYEQLQKLHRQNQRYLDSFIEYQFQLILCSLYQCQQIFYSENNDKAVYQMQHAITQLCCKQTKRSFQDQWQSSVQPVIDLQRLEPKELQLFKTKPLIMNQFARFTQCLLGLNKATRMRVQTQIQLMQQNCIDVLIHVHNETPKEVLTLQELELCKKFINEQASAQMYKFSLIEWIHGKKLPYSSQVYNSLESKFKDQFLWKVLEQKQELHSGLEQKVIEQQNLNLVTREQENQRDIIVHNLNKEIQAQKIKIVKHRYYTTRAEMFVFRDEIEKKLVQAAVKCLDSETQALAKCFTIAVPSIQYYIHPFQHFAATLFDQVDPNSNLDMSNRFSQIQSFLTKVRNRSTQIETLTSGPGIMITVKDLNEILIEFCRKQVVDQALELKSRNEINQMVVDHYSELCFLKDQQLQSYKQRLDYIDNNLDGIISAQLFEKGNQIVYELDNSNRILDVFKSHYSGMEARIQQRVKSDQFEKFKRIVNQLEVSKLKFEDYKQTIWNSINLDFAEDQDKVKQQLRVMTDRAKRTDLPQGQSKYYPASGQVYQKGGSLLPGAVVPDTFTHYQNCYCYVPNPLYPRPTIELAELDMLSEYEARKELAQLCMAIRKQRILYKTKEMCLMSKYQDKINFLEKQQNSNTLIWDQLSASDHREKVLKQELESTQSNLANAEKKIEDLLNQIKRLEADKCRLQKNNLSKVDRLQHLEQKVKKMDVFEIVDQDKLVTALIKTDKKLQDMSKAQIEVIQVRDNKYKQMLHFEQIKTKKVQEQLEQFKLEFKMLEGNESAKKLIDVCRSLQIENQSLRAQCEKLLEHCQVQSNSSLPQIQSKSVRQEEHVPMSGMLHSTEWRSGKRRQSNSTLILDSSSLTKAGSKTAKKSRQHIDSIFNSHQSLPQTEAISQLKAASRYRLD